MVTGYPGRTNHHHFAIGIAYPSISNTRISSKARPETLAIIANETKTIKAPL